MDFANDVGKLDWRFIIDKESQLTLLRILQLVSIPKTWNFSAKSVNKEHKRFSKETRFDDEGNLINTEKAS